MKLSDNIFFLDFHIAFLEGFQIGVLSADFWEFEKDLSFEGFFGEIPLLGGGKIQDFIDKSFGQFKEDSFRHFLHIVGLVQERTLY